jgi:hypothetical protein
MQPAGDHLRGNFAFVLIRFALFDHQLDMAEPRLLETADQKFAEIGGAGIAVEQPDPDLLRPGKRACRQVGRIAQAFDHGLDRRARRIAHAGLAVDDARHGHRRKARFTRDIGNCHRTGLGMRRFPVHADIMAWFAPIRLRLATLRRGFPVRRATWLDTIDAAGCAAKIALSVWKSTTVAKNARSGE